MDKHFLVWIKSSCPFCIKAQNELLQKGLNHTIYVMDDEAEVLQETKKLWNHPTVPIVVLQEGEEEKFIGGFTDLQNYLQANHV